MIFVVVPLLFFIFIGLIMPVMIISELFTAKTNIFLVMTTFAMPSVVAVLIYYLTPTKYKSLFKLLYYECKNIFDGWLYEKVLIKNDSEDKVIGYYILSLHDKGIKVMIKKDISRFNVNLIIKYLNNIKGYGYIQIWDNAEVNLTRKSGHSEEMVIA